MNSPATDPLTMAYHELRAPLALVVTAARSAAGEAQDGELRLRCEMIVRAAERMLRTASEMCGLEGPQEPGSEAAFQPAEIVDDIVVTMRGLDVPVTLRASTAARLAEVHGSRAAFETLVQSLLSNALDHGRPGGCIGVELDATPAGVTLDVLNEAAMVCGHRGRGLGTVVTQRLATQLGGSVSTASADGHFRARFTLPAPAA